MLRKLLGTHVIIIKSLKDPYDIEFGLYPTRWHKNPKTVWRVEFPPEVEERMHPTKIIETLVEEMPYPVKLMYYDG